MTTGAREMTLKLLSEREEKATICPSEVARRIAFGGNWQDSMPAVHSAIDELVAEGIIHLSWKGKDLSARAGPYRVALSTDS